MANYQDLKKSIVALIKQNGAQEITGDVLQSVLVSMVANLGQNYQFKGIAVPTGNPGTPDQNVFYFATQQGTYTNFGGAKIDKDSLFVFAYNGEWTTFDTGISAMPKDLHFLVNSNMAVSPYEDNVVLEMDVYNPSTGSSSVEEYKIPSATEEHAGVMSAADKKELGELNKTVDGLKYNKYDYLKINGLTTNSTSEQVKAALTPIGGTEVVFPTNGDTITNGTSISIEVLNASSNTFSYIYNNQLVSFGISLAEGREAVTSKVQTSLLKQMYDFAKINALTDESDNDDIEAAIRQLQKSTVSAPSAGALLVDASTLAPLAVVTDSSSDASAHIESFSYTHGGVKYTVTISGEQGALTAKVTTQAVTQRRYDLNKLNHLTEESSDADIRDALTPIGEAEMTVPKIGDVATMNNQGVSSSSIFLEVVEKPTLIGLTYECNGIIIFLRINKGDEYSAKVDKYDFGLFNKTLSTLQTKVTEQGEQIKSNTTNLNLQSRNLDISNMVQVVGVTSDGSNSGFDIVCVRAPKGLIWGSMKVKLYRKIKGRTVLSDLGSGRNRKKDRIKKGWLNFNNINPNYSPQKMIVAKLEQVETRDNMDSGYNANDGYDYFNIRVLDKNTNGNDYSKLFSEMVKDNCYLESNAVSSPEANWTVLQIKNGKKKKTVFNPVVSGSSPDGEGNYFVSSRIVTWGIQIQDEDSSVKYPYTGIIPFCLRIGMGVFGVKLPAETINSFQESDITVDFVKSK